LAEYDDVIRGPPFLFLPRAPPTLNPPLLVSTVTTRQYCASGRERDSGRLYESGYKKRMKKKKTVLNWCSIFHWQNARNNARGL